MPVWRLLRRPLRRTGQLERRHSAEHLFERDPDLQAGQVGAQAEVDAVPERQVRVGIAAEGEAVRVGEAPLVAVGRALPHHHLLSRRDVPGRPARSRRWPCAAWRVTGSSSAGSPRRPRPYGGCPARSRVELVGPVDEGQHGPGDGVAGGLGAGGEQEREEGGQLVVAQARRLGVGQLGVDDGREHVRRAGWPASPRSTRAP